MLFVNIYHIHFYVLKGIAVMLRVLYIGISSRDYCELSGVSYRHLFEPKQLIQTNTTRSARRVVFYLFVTSK